MVFYFTATGNSLYVAKQLDDELVSIPQEMRKAERKYKADTIGIVCPLFEFEMPSLVKDFIRNSVFETAYFYIVITFGCHSGGVAKRTQEFLDSIGREADYINTIIMHDNAIIVFDMDQQRSIEESKRVDEYIAAIKTDIRLRRNLIQIAAKGETDFYEGYIAQKKINGPMYTFPLYRITEDCAGCGTCSRVCPCGCIHTEAGRPQYDYTRCANCMACIQACPTKAIQFASVKEPNPNARYRNVHVSLQEIIAANEQK